MSDTVQPSPRHLRTWLPILLVLVIGLGVTGFFGVRAVRSFREFRYIQQQGLDRGAASVDAIRPWMTLRFVAVAYAVPLEYLYSSLAIPFEQRNANHSLGDLNREYNLGQVPNSTEFVIIQKAKAAITEYRKNPVATGLRDVRPWMSVRYIANSSGVSMETIFAGVGIPLATNEDKPLDLLSDEQHYRGGPPALVDAVKSVLAQQKALP